jgi:hypothetical protein
MTLAPPAALGRMTFWTLAPGPVEPEDHESAEQIARLRQSGRLRVSLLMFDLALSKM